MSITDYWQLPPQEQQTIKKANPETSCTICHKPEIQLLSCEACGEDVCFNCAVPCPTLKIHRAQPTSELETAEADTTILCKRCVTF